MKARYKLHHRRANLRLEDSWITQAVGQIRARSLVKNHYSFGCILIELYADHIKVINECERQLFTSEKEVGEFDSPTGQYYVYSTADPTLEQKVRRVAENTGNAVESKHDLTYRLATVGRVSLFSTHEGFESNRHSIIKDGCRFFVIRAQENEQTHRVALRVIREIILRSYENGSWCFCHAAAVKANGSGEGILILGNSGAGKTTSLWHLMARKQYQYVSNDRCMIKVVNGRLVAVGWPITIRIGMGLSTAAFSGSIDTMRFDRSQTPEVFIQKFDTEQDVRQFWGSRHKLELSAYEAHSLFGWRIGRSCKIARILFPNLQPDSTPAKLTAMTGEVTAKWLVDQINEPECPDYRRGWLGIRQIADGDLIQAKQRVCEFSRMIDAVALTGGVASASHILQRELS